MTDSVTAPCPVRPRLSAFLLLTAFLACLMPGARAELPDFPDGLLDMGQVLQAAAEITSERFPNSDDALVDDHILAVTWDDTVIKVLTEKGKRDNQTLSSHFTLPYSELEFRLVQVIKPDGTVTSVDIANQSRVMVDPSQMGSNIYNPNAKVLQVGIPNLEIGDLVRYVSLRRLVKPRVPDTWSDYQIFEYTSPIVRMLYEVRGPKELPLRSIALKAPVPGTVHESRTERDDQIVYRWEVTNVPRMYSEPSMPALHTVVQRLLVSTIPDWRYIARWYWDLSKPHLEPTDAIRTKVAELIEGARDEDEIVRRIFKFVSQEIRYMGITIEEEAPGYEPHDVSLTFESRHGVCRDKAALLVAMLRVAGLEAFPVLIHAGPKKDEEVPQPFFNHAVSAVKRDDGSYTLMDSTDESTKRIFPAYLCDKSYVVADPETDGLRTSPIVPADENLMHIRTVGRVDANGDLRGTSTLRFDGINDNVYRGYFTRIKPEERERFFEGRIKNFAPGAKLTGIEIRPEDMMDTDAVLEVELQFQAEDILVRGETMGMLSVPRLGTSVGLVNFILGNTGLDERKYPLETELACGVIEELELTLDSGIGELESIPDYDSIATEPLTWTRTLSADNGVLKGRSEFRIEVVEFSPEQYLDLKQNLQTIEYNDRRKPIFRQTVRSGADSPDSELVDSLWEYELEDEHNWTETNTVTRRILTYKGMKDFSELKFSHNPAWEDLDITYARVRNGDSVKEISHQEINDMDASWVGSAPRYPAAKTRVASLPGVEVGSVIEYQVRRVRREQPFFAVNHSFRGQDPMKRKTLRILAPPKLELRWAKADHGFGHLTDPAEDEVLRFEETNQGTAVAYTWTAEDQPAVRPEDDLPPWWSFNPSVFVSTGDWKRYGKRVLDAFEDAADRDKAVKEVVGGLDLGKDDLENLRRIRDYVVRNVRAAGPAFVDLPLTAITPADTVLNDGYGHSADRAVLLYAMLDRAGFRPEFRLVSWSPLLDELQAPLIEYPMASFFAEVLIRVKVDGSVYWLNDSDQYAQLGTTSHHRRLALEPGDRRPETVSVDDSMADRREIHYRVELSESGTARITRTERYYGTTFGANNRRFSEMPPEERRRYHQQVLTNLSQAARADGDLVTDFDAYPGVETFGATVERFAVRDGDYLYLNLPASLGNLLGLRADTRHNDLYWSDFRRLEVTTDILLPPGFQTPLLVPEQILWEAPDGAGSVTVTCASDDEAETDLTIRHQVDLGPALLEPDLYDQLLEMNRTLSHPRNATLLLSNGQSD
jgi:hypothetical protein